jgi:membrane protein
MLVWLWLSSFVILLGAVVNAQVEKHVYGIKTPDGASPFDELPDVPAEELVDQTPSNPLP